LTEKEVLEFLFSLSQTYFLPFCLWVVSTWILARQFDQLAQLSSETAQALIKKKVENQVIEEISALLGPLYNNLGLTPPADSAPFQRVLRGLLEKRQDEDTLDFISSLYNDLLQNGQECGIFHQIVESVLSLLGGG